MSSFNMMNPGCGDQMQSWYFAGGLFLSICMHTILLLQLSQMNLADAEIPHQLTVVEVELLHTTTKKVPKEITPEPPEPENHVQKESSIEREEPKPVKKEVPKPELQKKPVKKTTRKTIQKKIKHQIKPHAVKKASHAPELSSSSIATQTTIKAQPSPHNQAQLKQIKQQYLSRILFMIQSHKHYPYSARRRHIEGDIQVSFLVDKQGHISDLHITGGSSVLRSSTRLAIEDSLPFPMPSRLLLQPMHSRFIMQYRLK